MSRETRASSWWISIFGSCSAATSWSIDSRLGATPRASIRSGLQKK